MPEVAYVNSPQHQILIVARLKSYTLPQMHEWSLRPWLQAPYVTKKERKMFAVLHLIDWLIYFFLWCDEK